MDRALLKERVSQSKAIAWDTCHKIYILMDEQEVAKMKEYGYEALIQAEHSNPRLMYSTILEWYRKSCSLRFIEAVSTTENPNDGFETIVGQFQLLTIGQGGDTLLGSRQLVGKRG